MVTKPTKPAAKPNPKPKSKPKRSAEDIVCGFHGVQALLTQAPAESGKADVVEVLLERRRHDLRQKGLQQALAQAGIACRQADRDELQQWAGGVRHQGVIARVRRATPDQQPTLHRVLERLMRPALLLILDQVQDPHNLGACIRSAAGAAVDAVIVPKHGACPITASVTRVAAGAVGRVPVFYVANLARTMHDLQQRGVWITGGDADAAHTLYEVDLQVDTAIVIGAEGGGLRRLTRQHCDQLARIPLALAANVSSLNVSVAAALFLFEAVRQRARR